MTLKFNTEPWIPESDLTFDIDEINSRFFKDEKSIDALILKRFTQKYEQAQLDPLDQLDLPARGEEFFIKSEPQGSDSDQDVPNQNPWPKRHTELILRRAMKNLQGTNTLGGTNAKNAALMDAKMLFPVFCEVAAQDQGLAKKKVGEVMINLIKKALSTDQPKSAVGQPAWQGKGGMTTELGFELVNRPLSVSREQTTLLNVTNRAPNDTNVDHSNVVKLLKKETSFFISNGKNTDVLQKIDLLSTTIMQRLLLLRKYVSENLVRTTNPKDKTFVTNEDLRRHFVEWLQKVILDNKITLPGIDFASGEWLNSIPLQITETIKQQYGLEIEKKKKNSLATLCFKPAYFYSRYQAFESGTVEEGY